MGGILVDHVTLRTYTARGSFSNNTLPLTSLSIEPTSPQRLEVDEPNGGFEDSIKMEGEKVSLI